MFELPSAALHTDLYQLTMAQGYWKLGIHKRLAVFDLFFRENPFKGGYAVACGLESVVSFLQQYHFQPSDLEYLASLKASDGSALFQADFLEALSSFRFSIDLFAMEEGTLVFPTEPFYRVAGPLWECQLLETALLNFVNFPTLIATKAARVCCAAADTQIVEFGLRRAQGPNGGLTASRAAYVGGVAATSNLMAGQQFGMEVKGTHAHSWIMAFDSELDAFRAYASVMPNNCIFLVDTYHSSDGILHAIQVGRELEAAGHGFLGIRLDSGNLLDLSIEARGLLDEAGFNKTKIFASNDLDEYIIERLKAEGAKIDVWGVGTRLVTGHDQSSLGGVYKMVSIQDENGRWKHKAKVSDDVNKSTRAGIYNIRRCLEEGMMMEDVIYKQGTDTTMPDSDPKQASDLQPLDSQNRHRHYEELLKPIFRAGNCIYPLPTLSEIRKRSQAQLKALPKPFKHLHPTEQYPIRILEE